MIRCCGYHWQWLRDHFDPCDFVRAAEDDLRALRAQEVQTVEVQGKVQGETLTVPVVTPEQSTPC